MFVYYTQIFINMLFNYLHPDTLNILSINIYIAYVLVDYHINLQFLINLGSYTKKLIEISTLNTSFLCNIM